MCEVERRLGMNSTVTGGNLRNHNLSEQALRAGVIWRKTSFGSNSGRGLRMVERLLTVAETAKKRQRDLLGYLTSAVMAYRRDATPPLLLATS